MTTQYSYEDSVNVKGVFPVVPLYVEGFGLKYGESHIKRQLKMFQKEEHRKVLNEIKQLNPKLKGL